MGILKVRMREPGEGTSGVGMPVDKGQGRAIASALNARQPILAQAIAAGAVPPSPQPVMAPAIAAAEPMPAAGMVSNLAPVVDVAATQVRKPGVFGKGGVGWDVLGTIGDVLTGSGAYWRAKNHAMRREQELMDRASLFKRQDALRAEDRQWQVEDRDARNNAPQYFQSGRDRVRYDPVSGDAVTVYDGPEDYENYAASMGYQPGDDGYGDAVQDFTLRGNGPTAQRARQMLEGIRQQQRLILRGTPTYAQTHPRPASGSGGRGGGRGKPGGVDPSTLPLVRDRAEAIKLKPGTMFRTPDGRVLQR